VEEEDKDDGRGNEDDEEECESEVNTGSKYKLTFTDNEGPRCAKCNHEE